MISPDDFRDALRHFGSGVTIVTARAEGSTHGMTVSAFAPLSLDPPLIAVVINRSGTFHTLLENPDGLAVNILAQEQVVLSDRFAFSNPKDRFNGGGWTTAVTGAPVLADALAWLDCQIVGRYPAGTHSIVLASVAASRVNRPDDKPLIYWNRDYRQLSTDDDPATGRPTTREGRLEQLDQGAHTGVPCPFED